MLNPWLKMPMTELIGAPGKTGDVGVELEVEGEFLPPDVTGWAIKAEGSLRGKGGRVVGPEPADDLPREYVLSRPRSLQGLEVALYSLEKALKADKRTVVNITPRASTHVHLNMGTKTFHTFLGFVLLFMCAEPVLLRLCGPLRNGNLFCLPTYEAGDWPEIMRRLVQAPRHHWTRERKYSSLNIDPLQVLGSVEVRCFPNSVTPSEVLAWARWLVNLRTLAEAADDTFENTLDRIGTEPHRFLAQVFDDTDLRDPCHPVHPTELVQFGLEQAYEVWRSMEPLFNYSEKETKDNMIEAPDPNMLNIIDDPGDAPLHMWQAMARAPMARRAR